MTVASTLPFSPLHYPPSRRRHPWPRMLSDNILFILGATGSGKTSLSIDLASHHFPNSEIINSDKMQLYRGLDLTTNKLPLPLRRNVPHHLLAHFHPLAPDVTPSSYRSHALRSISDILSRRNLPILVGGSNSYIHSLLSSPHFPYRSCLLWLDVSFPVLERYLSKRVDHMLEAGMVAELADFYDPERAESEPRLGLRKAIGVPEFEEFFRRHHPRGREYREGDPMRASAYDHAVRKIKENTWLLTRRQLGKIRRLREAGWDLKRVDATAAVAAVLASDTEDQRSHIWNAQVVLPSVNIVNAFLQE